MSTNAPTQLDTVQIVSEFAPENVSAYFLDLEGLLLRIDSATTYYQVLGVDRKAGQEEIKASFHEVLNLLFPPYAISRTLPPEINARIERAFSKSSQAFGVLANFSRRKEYDGALVSIANRPGGFEQTRHPLNQSNTGPLADQSNHAATAPQNPDQLNLKRIPQRGEAFSEAAKAKSGNNRRRVERFKLSIPVRVTGYDRRTGKWHEMAETVDVSRTGIKIKLRRRVGPSSVLYITLPLPAKLRSHGFSEQSYNVYTLIRRVEPPRQGVRSVGLEFIGEHPPAGFLDKPWAIFRPKRTAGGECRRPNRQPQVEKVTVEYFDETMRSLSKDEARTENVSSQGLRILGTSSPSEFDVVRVTCERLNFEGMAALRSRFTAKDGVERICVQFIDSVWPLVS